MFELDTKQLNEKGFVLVRSLFQKQEIEKVRNDAKEVFLIQLRRRGILRSGNPSEEEFERALFSYFDQHLAEFMNCGKQIQHLLSLHRLSLDERIESALKQVGLDRPNISTRPVLYFNSKFLAREEVYWRVFPHQDWRSMQGSLDSIVVWLPLTDVDLKLGALEVVPGSHRMGLLTSEVKNSFGKVDAFCDDDFVSVEALQGDGLFFSAFLVHRSGENVTRSIRWSCHFRYNNLSERTFIERGFPHAYFYKPQDELITPEFPQPESLVELFARTD